MTSFHNYYQNPLGFPFLVQIDRRSVMSRYHGSTISIFGKKKPEKKIRGFNRIRTRDLRVTGVLLYQLSYE